MFEPFRRTVIIILSGIRHLRDRYRSRRIREGSDATGKNRTRRAFPHLILRKLDKEYLRIESALVPMIKKPDDIITIYGRKMVLDRGDSLDLSVWRVYDPELTNYIQSHVRSGSVVLDVGANIGYFTLMFSNLVGRNGLVYAFEPDPVNQSILRKNLELNSLSNVVLIPKAVAETSKRLTLYHCDENAGMHAVWKRNSSSASCEVEAVSIDGLCSELDGKVDFIKMDIEGAECGAVKGAQQIIERNRNITIVTEFSPVLIRGFGDDPVAFLADLSRKGFVLRDLNRGLRVVSPNQLGDFVSSLAGGSTNIVCTKEH